jgi:hypothetical protein
MQPRADSRKKVENTKSKSQGAPMKKSSSISPLRPASSEIEVSSSTSFSLTNPISFIEIDQLGMRSLKKANTAISAIENALAVWDASTQKPPELRVRVERLRTLHDALSAWERRMLKAMTSAVAKSPTQLNSDLESDPRVPLLREFSDICKR